MHHLHLLIAANQQMMQHMHLIIAARQQQHQQQLSHLIIAAM